MTFCSWLTTCGMTCVRDAEVAEHLARVGADRHRRRADEELDARALDVVDARDVGRIGGRHREHELVGRERDGLLDEARPGRAPAGRRGWRPRRCRRARRGGSARRARRVPAKLYFWPPSNFGNATVSEAAANTFICAVRAARAGARPAVKRREHRDATGAERRRSGAGAEMRVIGSHLVGEELGELVAAVLDARARAGAPFGHAGPPASTESAEKC